MSSSSLTASGAFEALKAREAAVLCASYGRYPVGIARASGSRLYGVDGKEYIDLLAGIAVCSLGHSHPAITAAIKEQTEKLIHVSNLFYQEEQVVLAEKLLSTSHAHKVFFANSGAEANEAAFKLARRYMQREKKRPACEIITLKNSFHGRTLACLAATGQEALHEGFSPLPEGFLHVPAEDIAALEAAISEKTAAVMVEIIQGEAGVRPLSPQYLHSLAALCRQKDILFMVDEIQTGLCRTGTFWAFEHDDLRPDIFTTAKALAGGLPMGAMCAVDKVAGAFSPGTHATTFGGGAVVCAAAIATLDVMQKQELAQRAATTGSYAQGLLTELQQRFPEKITAVRGRGLMLGIELCGQGQTIWQALLDKGFLLNLAQGTTLRLLPALTIEQDDLARFTQALEDVLHTCGE